MSEKVKFEDQLRVSPRDRCSQLIEDIQTRFRITLTIRDDLGILRLNSGEPLFKQPSYHMHHYCLLERDKRPQYNKQCNAYCSTSMSKRCRVDSSPFAGLCWKGMREIIVPIWRQGQHFITIFAAGFRDDLGRNAPNSKDYSSDICEAYKKLPVYNEHDARALTRVLYTLGLGILQEVDNARHKDEVASGRKQQIQLFIHYHAHSECSLEQLAAHLFLSPSRASKVVRELFNESFQNLIIAERIERAKHLLTTTDLNQESIADQCGFKSHFYFNRLFSKLVTIAPGAYRKRFTLPS